MSVSNRGTETLESLVHNTEALDIGIQFNPLKDIILELANRVDFAIKKTTTIQTIDNSATPEELQIINRKINDLQKSQESRSKEYSEEIRELKSFFAFQIKDVREKFEKSLQNMFDTISNGEICKPIAEPIPTTSKSFEDNHIEEDLSTLKKRFDNFLLQYNQQYQTTQQLLQLLQQNQSTEPLITPIPTSTTSAATKSEPTTPKKQPSNRSNPEEEKKPAEEAKPPADTKETNIESSPASAKSIPSAKSPQADETELIMESPKVEMQPTVTSVPASSRSDPRIEDILIQLGALQDGRKADNERSSQIAKAVNKIIAEAESQRTQHLQLKTEISGYSQEFERLLEKITENAVQMEKLEKTLTTRQYEIQNELLQAQHTISEVLTKYKPFDSLIDAPKDIEQLKSGLAQEKTERENFQTTQEGTLNGIKVQLDALRNSLLEIKIKPEKGSKRKLSKDNSAKSSSRSMASVRDPPKDEPKLDVLKEEPQKQQPPKEEQQQQQQQQKEPQNETTKDVQIEQPKDQNKPVIEEPVVEQVKKIIMPRVVLKEVEFFETDTQTENVEFPPTRFSVATPFSSTPNEIAMQNVFDTHPKLSESSDEPIVHTEKHPGLVSPPIYIEKIINLSQEEFHPNTPKSPNSPIVDHQPVIITTTEKKRDLVFSLEHLQNVTIVSDYKPAPVVLQVDDASNETIKKLQDSLNEMMTKNDTEHFRAIESRISVQQGEIDSLSKQFDQFKSRPQIIHSDALSQASIEIANAPSRHGSFSGKNADVLPNTSAIVVGPDGSTKTGVSTTISSNDTTPRPPLSTSTEPSSRAQTPTSRPASHHSAQRNTSSENLNKQKSSESIESLEKQPEARILIHVVQADIPAPKKVIAMPQYIPQPGEKVDAGLVKMIMDLQQHMVDYEMDGHQRKEELESAIIRIGTNEKQITNLINLVREMQLKMHPATKPPKIPKQETAPKQETTKSVEVPKSTESYKPPPKELEKPKPVSPPDSPKTDHQEEVAKPNTPEQKLSEEQEEENDESMEVASNASDEIARLKPTSSVDQLQEITEGQLRIFRDAIQDLRSRMQVLEKSRRDALVLNSNAPPDKDAVIAMGADTSTYDNQLRSLRRRYDEKISNLDDMTKDVRQELYGFMHTSSEQDGKIVNSITTLQNEVRDLQLAMAKVKDIQFAVPPPSQPITTAPPPPTIDMDQFKIKKKKDALNVPTEPPVLNITTLEVPSAPDTSGPGSPVIVEEKPPSSRPAQKPTPQKPKSLPLNKRPTLDQLIEVASQNEDGTMQIPDNMIPEPTAAPAPSISGDDLPFHGRRIPQPVEEVTVINAERRQDILETMLPYLVDLRTDLQLKIDTAVERTRVAEQSMINKVDKDYVEKFFRNMRYQITEVVEKVEHVQQAVPDRVTHEELKEFIDDLYAQLTKETQTPAGTVSYKCLFCGQTRNTVAGLITDPKVSEALGEVPKTRAGTRGAIIYGSDKQAYKGTNKYGRPAIASALDKYLPPLKSPTETK